MKLLVLTREFPPTIGGVVLFIHKLCEELVEHDHEVTVLAPWVPKCEEFDAAQKFKVHRYRTSIRPLSVYIGLKIISLYASRKLELIFLGHFMSTLAMGALFLHKFFRVPYVILSHSNDLRYTTTKKMAKFIGKHVLKNVPLMIANSRSTLGHIRDQCYHGPIKIVYPGVDIGLFKPARRGEDYELSKEFQGKKVVLTVSRLVPKKNIDNVLRALPRVMEEVPNLMYLIVGYAERIEEEQRLRSIVSDLQLQEHVRFMGPVKNELLPALYQLSDLFVMPSRVAEDYQDVESFGMTFIEAGACGKPVIGGRSGGANEAIVDGVTGLLVNPHSVEEISTAMLRVLTDKAYARMLGENGRRRAENEFQWSAVGERLDKILRHFVSGRET